MSDGTVAPPAIGADADAAAQARARALEIANRLSSKLGVPTTGATTPTDSVLGKRPRDEFPVGDGRPIGSRKKKIFVPVEKFPDVNFFGLIIGPRGTTLKQMEVDTGARIFLRGKGASKEGEEESDEELHVLIMADEDTVLERASTMIEELLHNPEKMAQVKQQQLSQVQGFPGQGGEFGSSAVQLPSSLYSDDAVANPITFAPHEKVHGETQELRIPHEKVGLVIGRSGETIKSIQVQTGCHIQISKENECPGPDRSVSLSGEPHQIESARVEILRIISETGRAAQLTRGPVPPTSGFSAAPGFSTPGLGHPGAGGHYGPSGGMYQQPDGSNSKTIYIPQIYVGLLIGKAGETIRNIQMKTGTMIQVQKDESSDPQTAQRPVTIIGPPHAVNQCEAEINTLIANSQLSGGSAPGVTGPTSGVSQSQTISIPNAAVGVIIGRMGETIKRIQSVTGTRVQISKDEGKPERDVTITGTQHQIDHARREIDSVIQGVELREMPPRGPSSRPPPSYPPHGGYGGAPSYGGAPGGYGHYPPPGHGYGAPPGYPPHHDPYYGAPAHDPYGGYGAHAPYGGYAGAGAPPTAAAPAAAAAAAPAETKPEAAASTDQAEYERAYYAHQAAYYAQHGAYDTAPFVWPPKQ